VCDADPDLARKNYHMTSSDVAGLAIAAVSVLALWFASDGTVFILAEFVPMRQSSDHNEERGVWPTRLAVSLATLVLVLAAVVTLASFGARWNRLCELTTHWRVQIAVATVLACFVLLLTRRWKSVLLAVAVALVNASCIAPLYLPQRHNPVTGSVCRAVSANVHTSNRDVGRFLEFIGSESPDFILAMEVDGRWQRALEDLDGDYPYSVIRPRPDNFGIALFSRRPIISHRVESLDDSGVPTIIAAIDFDGRPLNLVGTHPLPPIGSQGSELRDQHLHALGALVSRLSRPVIVLGDLNTTSWSPCFRELVQRGGLRDSRQGFGVQPTWPNEPWVLRIPIDHALISEDLIVTQRYVGPDIGSDHLPIVIAFAAE